MNITLFESLTTEAYLKELELESKKYDGLYVDMSDPEQRKYVKGQAVLINDILKKLERARIDLSRDYKVKVDEEAASIKERLEPANKPFTLLINAYNEERRKILAEKKAIEDAEQLWLQIEADHEQAIMMDKIATIEAREKAQAKADEIKAIQEQAANQARIEAEQKAKDIQFRKDKQADEERVAMQEEIEATRHEVEEKIKAAAEKVATDKAKELAEKERREANKRHCGKVNREAVASLMSELKMSEPEAKDLITVIAHGLIKNITINY